MGLAHAQRRRAASLLAKLSVSVCSALLSVSCFKQPLEPIAPSWDTNLSLPLLHRRYTLSELVEKDTTLLHVGIGGEIIYATTTPVNPTYIGDLITVGLRDTSFGVKFGTFRVDAPPVDIVVPMPWLPQGQIVPVPDTTVSIPELRDTIGSFQRVTFKSGTISLTLQNNLPVPTKVMSSIRLINSQGAEVATFTFPDTIYPNNSRTASGDLADKTLDNIIRITDFSLHAEGSQTPVPIPFGTLFSAHLVTNNVKASQAVFASIPPQRLADNDSSHVRVNDSTLVQELHIRNGELTLDFANPDSLDIQLMYRISELQKWNGASYVPYEDSILLRARESGSRVVSLAGSRISSQSQQLIRSLEVVSSVVLPTGSSTPVTVNETDRVLVTVTQSDSVVADSAIGVLKPTWVSVNTVVPVRFGDLPTRFSGQINIPSASLMFRTNSAIGFPMDLNARFGARRSATGDSAFLYIPSLQSRIPTGPGMIEFDQGDVGGFLSQFSNRLPNEFRIEGRTLVNPPDVYNPTPAGVGAVGRNSNLTGTAELQIPLMMGIVSGTYIDTVALGDTTADGRKDYKIDKNEINKVGSGSMVIEVTNAMPVRVGCVFRLLDIRKQSVLQVPQSGSGLQVAAASVDGQGNVTVPANSRVSFQLNETEVRQFNPAEYVTFALSIVTTPGVQAVRFRTTDYVEVRAWSSLIYRVTP